MKERLDQYLHEQGYAQSRERARALIMAGQVYLNGEKATKAGTAVPNGAAVEVRGGDIPYVSRGGLKLEKALGVFPVSPKGKVCMDVGASTGGFTDCMLQNGAAKAYAVDVGYGQLAWKLRCDERVVVLERTNIRHLDAQLISEKIEFFTIDVSFISLKLVLPAVNALAGNKCTGICLVKPQFEAGREKVGKKGVVRDAAVHLEVLGHAAGYAVQNGFAVRGLDYSPITGPNGNIEFLLWIEKSEEPEAFDIQLAEEVCSRAHRHFEGAHE